MDGMAIRNGDKLENDLLVNPQTFSSWHGYLFMQGPTRAGCGGAAAAAGSSNRVW